MPSEAGRCRQGRRLPITRVCRFPAISSLSALPDNEVARVLLPGAAENYLPRDEALRAVAESRGMVPVAVDPLAGGRIFWADIGDSPLREWQFTLSIKHFAETGAIKTAFVSDFDILDDESVGADAIYPSALVFHISRCGSTLLAKALARLEKHVVVNQGGPLQRGFWARLTDDFRRPLEPSPENVRLFRHIVLAMARRRSDAQSAAFVKFVSWNTVYLDFIRRAFPDVPCLFLYRNPAEVVASVIQRPTPALLAKGSRQAGLILGDDALAAEDMTDIEYLAHSCSHYFRLALEGAASGLKVLNYAAITPENFSAIVSHGLSVSLTGDEIEAAREQFKFHSKDDEDNQRFRGDNVQKTRSIPASDRARINQICGDLVDRLDESAGNLFR